MNEKTTIQIDIVSIPPGVWRGIFRTEGRSSGGNLRGNKFPSPSSCGRIPSNVDQNNTQ